MTYQISQARLSGCDISNLTCHMARVAQYCRELKMSIYFNGN
jgi:hypothetical protein